MLLRFSVANHRSIMAPVELSMVAVDEDRTAARRFDKLADPVLTVAGIYGANASGKSNILNAMAWLAEAVGQSLREWDERVPRDPFRFGDGLTEPSTFEVDMLVNGVRHTYHAVFDDAAVQFEALYSYPERRPRTLFQREGMDLKVRRGLGAQAGIRELLTPTTLALSAAMRLREPDLQPFARALASIAAHGVHSGTRRGRPFRPSPFRWATINFFQETDPARPRPLWSGSEPSPDSRAAAMELLRFADLGIEDAEVIREKLAVPGSATESFSRQRLRLIHRVADQPVPFDLDDESAGTRTWVRLIGPMLYALRYGQILLFDEIDASLHPRLSSRVIELFQDPETNPRGAQLIFTSHDTSLLNHLNRDEVWLTEKGTDGATTLTALAEYGGDKVRRSLNIEKAYLQGRFGAVPELDQGLVRRAIGLVATAP